MLGKKTLIGIVFLSLFSLASCWETDAENAVEDVGEKIEEVSDKVEDKVEDTIE